MYSAMLIGRGPVEGETKDTFSTSLGLAYIFRAERLADVGGCWLMLFGPVLVYHDWFMTIRLGVIVATVLREVGKEILSESIQAFCFRIQGLPKSHLSCKDPIHLIQQEHTAERHC